jgi:arylsulfatase A-like enzyme
MMTILKYALQSLTALSAAAIATFGAPAAAQSRHNVIIFVADGLRSGIVTPETAPTMAMIRSNGVDLINSHAMYPTLTTVNASAIATGHRVGDTGDFGNVIYVGAQTSASSPSPFAPVEDDEVLGGLNKLYGGDYLNEASVMADAHKAGYATAAIGKVGPIAIQDVTDRDGTGSLIIDDSTGYPGGLPLPADVIAAIKAAGLPAAAEDRGLNGSPGNSEMAGVWVANVQQQDWFTGVATKVVLPRFKAADKPFFLLFWSRDPDGTQHNQGDSLNTIAPGINGKTSMAGIRNADNDLAKLIATLKDLGLYESTDIIVIADHGFSTIVKSGTGSASAKLDYPDVPKGFIPPGFLAIDMASMLHEPLADAAGLPVNPAAGEHPRFDGALIGQDPKHPHVAIAADGGSDLIYLPGSDAKTLAPKLVAWLTTQDYVSAIFVNDALGEIPGALPFSAIGYRGASPVLQPSIVVSFKSTAGDCPNPQLCAIEVADTGLQQGQGMHGSFSRADTHNFMAAIGPDFKGGFQDPDPVSNADVAPTVAEILGLKRAAIGHLLGRPMSEALVGGAVLPVSVTSASSAPAANGFVTNLEGQIAGGEPYFDAAGAFGRTVGLSRIIASPYP